MLRSLAVSVLRYERVRTTEAKAKETRRLVEKVVGLGHDGSLVARRRAIALTRDRLIVEKVFTDLRERFADRRSGFTRLVRLGHRVGDGAPLALIALLEGAPAAAKTAEAAPAEPAAEGGVRGIARRLRGRAGEKAEQKAEEKAPQKPQPAKAARKAVVEKATPKAKGKEAGEKKKPAARKRKEKD